MYARIVTFSLTGPSHDEYREHATALADEFNTSPGLHAKYWLADREQRCYGGVYLFESAEAAHHSRTTPLFGQILANPTLAGSAGCTLWPAGQSPTCSPATGSRSASSTCLPHSAAAASHS